MSTFRLLLTIYVIGGLTFVPLLIGLILLYAYYTLPDVSKLSNNTPRSNDPANLISNDDASEKLVLKTATDNLAEKFHRKHDSDVAAGYFAVCRDYVPGGVNGKPPEKLSPAGEVVATESPSVYQSMYRSIFDRSQKPTLEPHKDGGIGDTGTKKLKKANNVFYVVLRHGHLMLYDDIQQLEVRYVVSLEYHDVDIYGGAEDEKIPEAELWMKRNAIRLTRRPIHAGERNLSRPFFFFSEHLSEKEDFYFALLKNQEKNSKDSPTVQEFEVKDIIYLVQKLHSSEEQLETRWLNALAGRVFLAIYKTPFLENLIRTKLTKKLSRVKKPAFITRLALQKIDPGTAAPFITNPRLKDLSVNGDCVVEMDIEYVGHFRIEVAATARLDLGARFKAREVDMVLAATCKRLSGHLLLRLKPQPSNRLWISFEKMPKVELALEPIVSSRQITYGIILRAMESRIMEVIAETLVLPFWDDMPFFDTSEELYRGGIWKKDTVATVSTEIEDEDAEDEAEAGKDQEKDVIESMKRDERIMSMPVLSEAHSSAALHAAKKSVSSLKETIGTHGSETPTKPQTPRVMRSTSFASMADPTLSPAHADGATPPVDVKAAQKRDSMLLDFSRSLSTSPTQSASGSLALESTLEEAMRSRNRSDTSKSSIDSTTLQTTERKPSVESQHTLGSSSVRTLNHSLSEKESISSRASSNSRAPSVYDGHHKGLTEAAKSLKSVDRKQAMNSINAAASAAQKWGWGVLARNRAQQNDTVSGQEPGLVNHRLPMGRGQPLPPPGMPLPGPETSSLFSMSKRKPLPSPRPSAIEHTLEPEEDGSSLQAPALPDRPDRRRRQASLQNEDNDSMDEVLVVAAPIDSNPASPTPAEEHHDEFFGHGEEPVTPPPLPLRRENLEKSSLDTVSGGAIRKATERHQAAGVNAD